MELLDENLFVYMISFLPKPIFLIRHLNKYYKSLTESHQHLFVKLCDFYLLDTKLIGTKENIKKQVTIQDIIFSCTPITRRKPITDKLPLIFNYINHIGTQSFRIFYCLGKYWADIKKHLPSIQKIDLNNIIVGPNLRTESRTQYKYTYADDTEFDVKGPCPVDFAPFKGVTFGNFSFSLLFHTSFRNVISGMPDIYLKIPDPHVVSVQYVMTVIFEHTCENEKVYFDSWSGNVRIVLRNPLIQKFDIFFTHKGYQTNEDPIKFYVESIIPIVYIHTNDAIELIVEQPTRPENDKTRTQVDVLNIKKL